MNVTKADILKALDWFDENYGDAIDDEDIEELCTWQNNYDKANDEVTNHPSITKNGLN